MNCVTTIKPSKKNYKNFFLHLLYYLSVSVKKFISHNSCYPEEKCYPKNQYVSYHSQTTLQKRKKGSILVTF